MQPLYDGLEFEGEWESSAEYDVGSESSDYGVTGLEIGYDSDNIHMKIEVEGIESFLAQSAVDEGTPHIQIYIMAANAVDNNVPQANFHTYYGQEPLNMPTTKMLWFDFGQLRSDGRMTYNTFLSQGNEEWSL